MWSLVVYGDDAAVTLTPLETPLLAVSKGETVIQLSPTSLRFWEKLGLSPRAGPKDVVAFVFFEEKKDEDREAEIENWLAKVSSAYSVYLLIQSFRRPVLTVSIGKEFWFSCRRKLKRLHEARISPRTTRHASQDHLQFCPRDHYSTYESRLLHCHPVAHHFIFVHNAPSNTVRSATLLQATSTG